MPIVNINPVQGNAAFQQLTTEITRLAGTTEDRSKSGLNGSSRAEQNGVARIPWVMTTTEWLTEKPPRAIIWAANPHDVGWNMSQRASMAKHMFGTVLHVWPDSSRNTFYDEIRLTLNLQTGNLMPIFLASGNKYVESDGIVNFYTFMQLVDAPKITNEPIPRANLVHITYNSPLFPNLTLLGMFDPKGISFNDSSDSPNAVASWSAEFVVYDSIPRLTDNSGQPNTQLLNTWIETRIKSSPVSSNVPGDVGTVLNPATEAIA
jgi:hypothetical protein